jgi:hypothetical protein
VGRVWAILALLLAAGSLALPSRAVDAGGGEPTVARAAQDGSLRTDGWGTVTRTSSGRTDTRAGAAGGDPDLQPGFPVRTYERGGTYHAGPAINVLVVNIDGDASLELCSTALSIGPMYCWQHTGALIPGWGPAQPITGAAYGALGFSSSGGARGLVIGHFGDLITARDPAGNQLPGWPVDSSNYVSTPPSLSRVGGQPVAVIGEEDWALHAYRKDTSIPAGWPSSATVGGQERHTPATSNVDGTAGAEIFSASGWTSPGVYLFGIRPNGSVLDGYPLLFQGEVDTFPAVGDVDADGELEVVIVGSQLNFPWTSTLIVVTAATGEVEGMRDLSGAVPYGTAPALADLDQQCSGPVEIIVQTESSIDVVRWNGSSFANYPGWPKTWGAGQWIGDSSPVVGDVDGDGLPDIVFTGQVAGSGTDGAVYAYSRGGAALAGFPKPLALGAGGVPAIADVDRDGRNEIAVKGSPWNGFEGLKQTLWLYDLGGSAHGPVHWGQFMHDAAHTGRYVRSYCR